MIELLAENFVRFLILASWFLLIWKSIWLVRKVKAVVHYFRSREALPHLRQTLIYFGFIEDDDK